MARKHRSRGGSAPDDRHSENTISPGQGARRPRAARTATAAGPLLSELLAALRSGGSRRPQEQTNKPVLTVGTLPAGLADHYHAQPSLLRRHIDYYEGDVAPRPAFRDRGGKLIAYQVDSTTVASLLSIARHRHWKHLQVAGDRPFRRAVWLDATRAGLTVTGYRPSARDRDAAMGLERPVATPAKRSSTRTASAQNGHEPAQAPPRQATQAFQQGVVGLLVEHGEAPYQNQVGGKPTPFLRVDIGAARPFEIWGVDLTKSLQEAKIKTGDAITLSWHGPDYGDIRVQKAAAVTPALETAGKTHRSNGVDGAKAAPNPAAPARAHLAVVDAIARAKLNQPKDRAKIGAAAKAKLAQHLARGSDFALPAVAERSVRPAPELGPAPSYRSNRERDR